MSERVLRLDEAREEVYRTLGEVRRLIAIGTPADDPELVEADSAWHEAKRAFVRVLLPC